MALKRYSIFLIIFIVFVFVLIFPKVSLAVTYYTECGETFTIGSHWSLKCSTCRTTTGGVYPCCPCCNQYSCSGSWDEYRVESTECGADIMVRHCQSVCGPGSACCGCGPCQAQCTKEVYKKVGSWQKAERTGENACEVTNWGLVAPEVKCQGECVKAPVNPRYYNNPSYPTNSCSPEKSMEPNNVYLPVKLDWDDVEGWKDGWCKDECLEGCVQSYVVNIKNATPTDPLISTTTESTFISPACNLKSGATHDWQVKACCTVDGHDCGPESKDWSLTTNLAPEPVSPDDPDWTGEKLTENASPILDWCPVENAGSYFLEIYREDPETLEGRKLLLPQRIIAPSSLYNDDTGWQEIKKGVSYWWHVLWCAGRDTPIEECSPFSQLWGLISGQGLLVATNLLPEDGSAVNISTMLNWLGPRSAAAYWVNIQGEGLNKNFQVPRFEEGKAELLLKEIWGKNLRFDTLYYWQVAVCSKTECGNWSKIITFRTTGAQPTNIKFEPSNESGEIGFPLTVSWDNMPGAASYTIEVPAIQFSKTTTNPKITLDFTPPYLQQGKTYTISIKTCADEQGEFCGKPATTNFTVATLDPPVITQPEQGKTEFIPSIGVQSEEIFGANVYQYQLLYAMADPEETAECKAKVGFKTEKVIPGTSGALSALCTGQYSLQVRGCIDPTCSVEQGQERWSNSLTFEIQEKPGGAGLIPCGQSARGNNPWDAREPCQTKHIFLLIKIIINFLFFRAVPIILVLLTVYSGIIFYFAQATGTTNPIIKVRSLWRATGIGLLIIFFAWLFVNFLLSALGFPVNIFGHWYQIPL